MTYLLDFADALISVARSVLGAHAGLVAPLFLFLAQALDRLPSLGVQLLAELPVLLGAKAVLIILLRAL